MEKFFIQPYPEEVFYSIIARYYKQTLSFSPKQFSSQVFSSHIGSATLDLPSHLDTFHSLAKQVFPFSVDEIIEKFTLYPFYAPFLRKEKKKAVLLAMRGNIGNTIHTRVGINASKTTRYRYPRFCPVCVEDNPYAEAFWARLPQTDLIVCTQHNCFISNYTPSTSELNRSFFIPATRNLADKYLPTFNKEERLLQLASIYSKILTGDYRFDINQTNYLEKIQSSRYYKQKSINVYKLTTDFKNFHGIGFLEIVLSKTSKNISRWLPHIIKRPNHFFHPLRHILVNEFVQTIETNEPPFHNPFNFSQWYCINKASEHFNQLVNGDVSFYVDQKTKRQVNIFSCSCGMVFTKSNLLKNGQQQEFIRIKDWGLVWKDRLSEELKTEKSFRAIALILGTDAKTVSAISRSFKEPIKNKKNEINRQQRIKNRKEWSTLMASFHTQKVLNSRQANKKLYAWLYRNDNAWLLTINKLNAQSKNLGEFKLNWKQLDSELLEKVSDAINKLKSDGYRGRISKTIISKVIQQEKNLLTSNIHKLPLTKEYISASSENTKDYQIRRLRTVLKEIPAETQNPVKWKVMRKAGLKHKVDSDLNNEIEKALGFA